jgi:hypothetical protein
MCLMLGTWILENSGNSEEPLLLARNEEGNCILHSEMLRISKGQG